MTKKTHLRVNQLIAAARTLQGLYTADFIHATATVTDIKETSVLVDPDLQWTVEFEVPTFCHGRAVFAYEFGLLRLITLLQFTAQDIAYSEFYRSRHGNEEMLSLLLPLLEAKLRPVVYEAINIGIRQDTTNGLQTT